MTNPKETGTREVAMDAKYPVWVIQYRANNGLWYPARWRFYDTRKTAELDVRKLKAVEHKYYRARRFEPASKAGR